MKKVVIAFDKEVTEAEQKLVDKLRLDLKDLNCELEAIGGGVKNPK